MWEILPLDINNLIIEILINKSKYMILNINKYFNIKAKRTIMEKGINFSINSINQLNNPIEYNVNITDIDCLNVCNLRLIPRSISKLNLNYYSALPSSFLYYLIQSPGSRYLRELNLNNSTCTSTNDNLTHSPLLASIKYVLKNVFNNRCPNEIYPLVNLHTIYLSHESDAEILNLIYELKYVNIPSIFPNLKKVMFKNTEKFL
jgi:hypothetical protein